MNGLAQWAAFTDLDDITLLENKGWAAVSRDLGVPLLETLVLGDPVEVVTADDDSAPHLGRNNDAPHETAADGDGAGERALAVDILGADSAGRCGDAETDVLVVTWLSLLTTVLLGGEADLRLLLEGALGLDVGHAKAGRTVKTAKYPQMKTVARSELRAHVFAFLASRFKNALNPKITHIIKFVALAQIELQPSPREIFSPSPKHRQSIVVGTLSIKCQTIFSSMNACSSQIPYPTIIVSR